MIFYLCDGYRVCKQPAYKNHTQYTDIIMTVISKLFVQYSK